MVDGTLGKINCRFFVFPQDAGAPQVPQTRPLWDY